MIALQIFVLRHRTPRSRIAPQPRSTSRSGSIGPGGLPSFATQPPGQDGCALGVGPRRHDCSPGRFGASIPRVERPWPPSVASRERNRSTDTVRPRRDRTRAQYADLGVATDKKERRFSGVLSMAFVRGTRGCAVVQSTQPGVFTVETFRSADGDRLVRRFECDRQRFERTKRFHRSP
jgi:hypothetical protein